MKEPVTMDKTLEIGLHFKGDPDPEVGSITTVSIPRPGDLVRTAHGLYEVERIVFDNINVKVGCVIRAIVSPSQYQIPL